MSAERKKPGRLRGGLSRIRARLRLWHFLRKNGSRIGWAFAEGAIGAAIGLVIAIAYLAAR
ncbi:hypothetical protein ACFPM3_20405 [Streptomyces coeruleoprunus]|uniref:Uncharacterized protein n=1 Tax=Streptomyces coeruleoprunus TaxID=285563 RepID=A0ABV9XJ83_9ACTN